MYCPHCGALLQDGAVACQNCGTSISGINNTNDISELENVPAVKPVARASKVSLWTGVVAAFPYFCGLLAMAYSELLPVTSATSDWVRLSHRIIFYPALLGVFIGIPFGLAAVIAGVVGYTKHARTRKNVTTAILGILFGAGGVLGHIWTLWFVLTCQFCQ